MTFTKTATIGKYLLGLITAVSILSLASTANAQSFSGFDDDPIPNIIVRGQRPTGPARDAQLNRMIADEYAERFMRDLMTIINRAYDAAAAALADVDWDEVREEAEENRIRDCRASHDSVVQACYNSVQTGYERCVGSAIILGVVVTAETGIGGVPVGATAALACQHARAYDNGRCADTASWPDQSLLQFEGCEDVDY